MSDTTSCEDTFENRLDAVRRSAAELLAGLADRPRELRVRAGDVTFEIAWPDAVAAVGVPAVAAEPAVVPVVPVAASETPAVRSPSVGVFYRAPRPGAEPFVQVGDEIVPGQQIGIVETMKLMIPVEADRGGRIDRVVREDGASVEFGEPLFVVAAGGVSLRAA